MKQNTIKKVIREKLQKWFDSIEVESVKAVAKQNTIVSGGCITSMLLSEDINDYDLYFRDKHTARLIAEYYVKIFNEKKLATSASHHCNPEVKFVKRVNIRGEEEDRLVIYMKSSGIAAEGQAAYHYFESRSDSETQAFIESLNSEEQENIENQDLIGTNIEGDPLQFTGEMIQMVKDKTLKYRPIFFTENAITLAGKIQLVIRFFGEATEIHDNYDFVHCMCWYDYAKDELFVSPEAMASILSKSLVYKGSLYPVASLFRIRKFIKRGWRITAGQMLKIIMQVSKLDLENINILREQLIGVDQAYMHQLLEAIQNAAHDRVDTAYLAKLIDEIFE